MNQLVSVGRIVHYRARGNEIIPAIVTHVDVARESVCLTLFKRGFESYLENVQYAAADAEPQLENTWHWPERV